MANWTEALRTFLVGLERLEQIALRLERAETHLDDLGRRVRETEIHVARLLEAQTTTRETVRAEIANAVADLRVRYAEERHRSEGTRRRLKDG